MMKLVRLLGCSALMLGTAACGGSGESSDVRQAGQNLTLGQDRVLGFEAPSSDWTANNGSPVGSTTDVTQGSAALTITPNGYTQLNSTQISAVGAPVASNITFDMKVPAGLSWGTVELVFKSPSQGLWWTHVGTINASGSTPGYKSYSFPMPGPAAKALASDANDITFTFVINGPSGAQYTIDNLFVGGDTSSPPADPPPIPRTLSLNIPRGYAARNLLFSATRKVTVDDRSTLSRPGEKPIVASVGPQTTEFGADIDGYVDIVSQGDVDFVRSQAHIYGDVTTGGTINIQDASVQIDGVQTEHAAVSSTVTDFTVQWPSVMTKSVYLETDIEDTPVDPGAYNQLRVGSRSTVTLRTGEYFFKSVVFEPQAHFRVDASRGPVRIYVENELRLNVPLEYLGGRFGHVLFGYLGTEPAYFEEHIVATVLAPNSAIELRRPASELPHGGQFFGKEVHVFSDATVLHVPFPFDFICNAGDADRDGTFDCWDECTTDPEKTEPGICGCGVAETDSDGNLVPDCIDQDPDNPDTTFVGQCGEKGVDAAPAGTPCTDGIELGEQECDGEGTCGNPNNDSPEGDGSGDPGGCTWVTYDSRAYWVCSGGGGASHDDAVAKCGAVTGRALVRIDHRVENGLIAALAGSVGGAVRIGAVDLDGDGDWAWANKDGVEEVPVWTGGPTGTAFHGMFNSWSTGSPGDSSSNGCAVIDGSGRWTVDDCSTPRAYVCEQTFGCSRYPNCRIPEDEPLPVREPYVPHDTDCIPHPDVDDPVVLARMQAENEACSAACAAASTKAECDEACTDCKAYCDAQPNPAACVADCTHTTDPPADGELCDPQAPAQVRLEAFEPQACTGDADCNTGGTVGRRCAFGNVCYGLQGSDRDPVSCSNDGDCPAFGSMLAGKCDTAEGLCLFEGREAACDEDSNDCMAACFAVLGCGVAPVTDNASSFEDPCHEVKYCSVPYDDPTEIDDFTDSTAFNRAQLPDEAGLDPGEYPDDFEGLPTYEMGWDTCADSSAGCDRNDRHPWCNYNASSPGSPEADATDNKEGVRGKNSPTLKVTFDPGADLKFETTPLPFGMTRYDALASVSARSEVQFSLLGFGGTFELLELRGELEASICNVSTKGSRLSLLGVDFLPAIAGDSGVIFDSDELDGLSSEKCEEAIAAYVDSVDRAKKALRDAQELVAQYKSGLPDALKEVKTRADLPALADLDPATLGEIRTFADGFCEDVLGPEDKRPPGMRGSCAEETDPTETINEFIKYYEEEAKQIDVVKNGLSAANKASDAVNEGLALLDTRRLIQKLGEKYPGFGSIARVVDGYSYSLDLVNLEKNTDVTIVSVQFFIGPIPALLQVGASGKYGVSGGFLVELQPQSLISGSGPIASAGATVTPYIGAAVTLFAGAGFSAGPLELKLGLTAGLSLVNVNLPASVKAGLNVNSSPETRLTIPANLASLATEDGRSMYPFNGERLKYDFSFRYDYGINLTLNDILAGYLDATVKVKFFFFSLKYSQRLVDFKGLPAVSINLLGGGGPFLDTTPAASMADPEPRISGHFEEMVLSDQQQPWKASFEEVPFVDLEPLVPFDEILAALPDGVAVVEEMSFDNARVGEVLYNNQCGCTIAGDPCTRNQDCCLDGNPDGSVTCFADPEVAGASSFCSACRKSPPSIEPEGVPNPKHETCNTADDCCDPEARCIQEPIPSDCHFTDPGPPSYPGEIILIDWVCDTHTMPTTKVCHPPLPVPWTGVIR